MSFQCSNPDFTIRSTDDGTVFEVNRSALETSQVFKGMFSCCDESTNSNQVLDLPESAGSLSVLLQLLHTPPLPPRPLPDSSGNASVAGPDDNPHQQTTDSQSDYQARTKPKGYDPSTIIPFPLLKLFLQLADKYEIESSTLDVLASHLMVYAIAPGLAQPNLSQVDALDVYALATTYGMDAVASKASQHVKSMASYGIDEVRALPTVQAYHKLVKLQDYRVKAIRELVLSEPLFPHGYGACSNHQQDAITIWERTQKAVAGRVEIGIDIAGEMIASVSELFKGCRTCHKAAIAAAEMLDYKCQKVPKRLDQFLQVSSF